MTDQPRDPSTTPGSSGEPELAELRRRRDELTDRRAQLLDEPPDDRWSGDVGAMSIPGEPEGPGHGDRIDELAAIEREITELDELIGEMEDGSPGRG